MGNKGCCYVIKSGTNVTKIKKGKMLYVYTCIICVSKWIEILKPFFPHERNCTVFLRIFWKKKIPI